MFKLNLERVISTDEPGNQSDASEQKVWETQGSSLDFSSILHGHYTHRSNESQENEKNDLKSSSSQIYPAVSKSLDGFFKCSAFNRKEKEKTSANFVLNPEVNQLLQEFGFRPVSTQEDIQDRLLSILQCYRESRMAEMATEKLKAQLAAQEQQLREIKQDYTRKIHILRHENEKSRHNSMQADDSISKELLNGVWQIFGISSYEEVIPYAKKIETVLRCVPRMEGMIREIALAVHPEIQSDQDQDLNTRKIEHLPVTISYLMKEMNELNQLRDGLIQEFSLHKDAPVSEILKFISNNRTSSEAIAKFRTIFQASQEQNILGIVNEVILFVHEVNVFRKRIRRLLGLERGATLTRTLETVMVVCAERVSGN